ncbi:hypothetical protein TNCV_806511 [Trichonephila clavipes]|nr:hypothetical protein TNCV_806511 [Trichonephila clavipes]
MDIGNGPEDTTENECDELFSCYSILKVHEIMFDPSSFANPTPLAHADTSRDVLPRGGTSQGHKRVESHGHEIKAGLISVG